METKNDRIVVGVTEEEKAVLRAAAIREGLNMAAYVRRQALLAARGAPRTREGDGAAA